MKSGFCPKCSSREVYAGENIKMKQGAYGCNTIPLGGFLGSQVALDNYVCCQCGYLESYINNPKDIKKIAELWEKVEG